MISCSCIQVPPKRMLAAFEVPVAQSTGAALLHRTIPELCAKPFEDNGLPHSANEKDVVRSSS